MILALLPLVLAASPTQAELEDVDHWQAGARALLDGPASCVELEGTVEASAALFSPGGWLGPGERRDLASRGTFSGRLDHGTWTKLEVMWSPAEGEDRLSLGRLQPMVGRLPPLAEEEEGADLSISIGGKGTSIAANQGSEEALGLLDQILDDIHPATTTSWAEWESEMVILHEFVPIDEDGKDELELRTTFPDAGPALAMDALFPRRIHKREGLVSITLMNAQLHLRGQQTSLGLLPGEERAGAVMGALGYTVGIEQHLVYTRARPCPAAAISE